MCAFKYVGQEFKKGNPVELNKASRPSCDTGIKEDYLNLLQVTCVDRERNEEYLPNKRKKRAEFDILKIDEVIEIERIPERFDEDIYLSEAVNLKIPPLESDPRALVLKFYSVRAYEHKDVWTFSSHRVMREAQFQV